MIIDTHSWHYKTMIWAYGRRYFFYSGDWQERKPVALCPYVDRLVLAIVASPLIALWRALWSDNLRLFAVVTSTGLMYGVLLSFFSAPWWLGLVTGLTAIWVGFGWLEGVHRLVEYWGRHHPSTPKPKKEKKPKAEKPKQPRKPNIFWEWLKARHRKVCPYLQFSDEKEGLVSL